MDRDSDDRADLLRLIEDLTEQVKTNRLDIAALVTRADASDARADASEARADAAEARADVSEVRADASEVRADVSDVRLDDLEARELVDHEMIAELQADGELSREHAKQMDQALRSSRIIGAAMGMIMASRQVSEDQAFAVLAKASQDSNRKLREIAELVIEGTMGHSAADLGAHVRRQPQPGPTE